MNNLITIFVLSSIFIILISLIIIISKLFQNQNKKDELIMSLLNKPEKEIVYIQKQPEIDYQESILPSPFFIGDYTLPYFNYYDDYNSFPENKYVKKISNKNHINIPYTGDKGNIKININ